MKMTPAQIANKHYSDDNFYDCKLHCMRCDDEVCESQEMLIMSLTKDIIECLETFNIKERMTDQEKATKILFYLLAFTICIFALSVFALLYVYAHPTINIL